MVPTAPGYARALLSMPPLASPPTRPIRSQRTPRCRGCWLPTALCLCADLPRLAVRARVVLVTHRREVVTSTNTGRLAARVLEGASVRVRGVRDAAPPEPLPEGRRLALFPAPGARVLSLADADGERVVLLVPDGTWSQARRLLRRDDDLRDIEAVALPPAPPTRYGLRRTTREGALCTIEAIAAALGVLEGDEIEARLLEIRDRFVERALRARGGQFER